jgi:hypothetical protein
MRDRAATYDKPEGERSMGATVDAFLAVTGVSMTEEQGWLFMALLKAVRSQQGAYRADSYEDGAAYFALAGEAAVRDRNGGWTDKAIKAAALPRCGPMCATCHTIHGTQDRCPAIEPASAIEDDSERMQAIGQNGNDGEHYDHERIPSFANCKIKSRTSPTEHFARLDNDGRCWSSRGKIFNMKHWQLLRRIK